MEKYKIDISNTATQDIRGIFQYITNDLQEPITANKTVDTVIDAIFTLESMPERIGFVRDSRLAKMEIRGLQVKSYTVFFRINETQGTVDVIRVLYSRRDWKNVLLLD